LHFLSASQSINALQTFVRVIRHDAAARRLMLFAISVVGSFVAIRIGASLYNDLTPNRLDFPPILDPSTEGGIPERFNQLMLLATSLLLLRAAREHRSAWLAFLACVFGFAFLDDAFAYHETMGIVIVEVFELQPVGGLRALDLGEIVAWGIAAAALVVPGLLAWRRCPQVDGNAVVLLGLFAGLVFFAVVADMLHVLAGGFFLGKLVGLIEDGGEMLMVALALSFSYALTKPAWRNTAREKEPEFPSPDAIDHPAIRLDDQAGVGALDDLDRGTAATRGP
jgi:hypothetical protein